MSLVEGRNEDDEEEDDESDVAASGIESCAKADELLAWQAQLYRVRSAASLLSSLASGGSYSLAGQQGRGAQFVAG